jgi:hypothetical protein
LLCCFLTPISQSYTLTFTNGVAATVTKEIKLTTADGAPLLRDTFV